MANRQFGITPNGRLLTRLEGEIAGFDRFSSKTVNFSRFSGFLAVGRRGQTSLPAKKSRLPGK